MGIDDSSIIYGNSSNSVKIPRRRALVADESFSNDIMLKRLSVGDYQWRSDIVGKNGSSICHESDNVLHCADFVGLIDEYRDYLLNSTNLMGDEQKIKRAHISLNSTNLITGKHDSILLRIEGYKYSLLQAVTHYAKGNESGLYYPMILPFLFEKSVYLFFNHHAYNKGVTALYAAYYNSSEGRSGIPLHFERRDLCDLPYKNLMVRAAPSGIPMYAWSAEKSVANFNIKTEARNSSVGLKPLYKIDLTYVYNKYYLRVDCIRIADGIVDFMSDNNLRDKVSSVFLYDVNGNSYTIDKEDIINDKRGILAERSYEPYYCNTTYSGYVLTHSEINKCGKVVPLRSVGKVFDHFGNILESSKEHIKDILVHYGKNASMAIAYRMHDDNNMFHIASRRNSTASSHSIHCKQRYLSPFSILELDNNDHVVLFMQDSCVRHTSSKCEFEAVDVNSASSITVEMPSLDEFGKVIHDAVDNLVKCSDQKKVGCPSNVVLRRRCSKTSYDGRYIDSNTFKHEDSTTDTKPGISAVEPNLGLTTSTHKDFMDFLNESKTSTPHYEDFKGFINGARNSTPNYQFTPYEIEGAKSMNPKQSANAAGGSELIVVITTLVALLVVLLGAILYMRNYYKRRGVYNMLDEVAYLDATEAAVDQTRNEVASSDAKEAAVDQTSDEVASSDAKEAAVDQTSDEVVFFDAKEAVVDQTSDEVVFCDVTEAASDEVSCHQECRELQVKGGSCRYYDESVPLQKFEPSSRFEDKTTVVSTAASGISMQETGV